MFRPDLQAISSESSIKYAAYDSTYLFECSQVIRLWLYLQFLKSKLWLNIVRIQLNKYDI